MCFPIPLVRIRAAHYKLFYIKHFLTSQTFVLLLSQLSALSSVTSVEVVISHVTRAGLDKAQLGTTQAVRIHPVLCTFHFL